MIQRLFLSAVAAAGCTLCLCAEEPAPNPLSIVTAGTDGTVHQFHIADVDKITFEGINMLVSRADGSSESIPVADIEKMCFDLEYDGTTPVAAELAPGLSISIARSIVTATADDPAAPIVFNAYDPTGAPRLTLNSTGTLTADMNTLPAGIYIIKINSRTIKFVNR